MKRWWISLLAACVVLSACAGLPSTTEGEVTEPLPQPAGTVPASVVREEPNHTDTEEPVAAGETARILLSGEAQEWTGIYREGKEPAIVAKPGACEPTGAGLRAELRQADWRPSPGSNGSFFAPSAAFVLCNAGTQPLPAQDITAAFTEGEVHLRLPPLNPGDGVGPIRFYSAVVVPMGTMTFWAEDGRRWPAWRVKLTAGDRLLAEGELTRGFGDAVITVPPDPEMTLLPSKPGLNDLRRLAFGYERIRYGAGATDFYLYAPDVTYERSRESDCATERGALEAGGSQWAFWVSVDDGEPFEALLVGRQYFPGGRSLRVEHVPGQGMTLLLLERYLSCANPMVYDIFAYDHRAGDLFRPQMKIQDGQIVDAGAARLEVLPDGKLISRIYQNYGLVGTHTYIYRWEAGERMWVFESHEHTA